MTLDQLIRWLKGIANGRSDWQVAHDKILENQAEGSRLAASFLSDTKKKPPSKRGLKV
jgi:hypothetical protein